MSARVGALGTPASIASRPLTGQCKGDLIHIYKVAVALHLWIADRDSQATPATINTKPVSSPHMQRSLVLTTCLLAIAAAVSTWIWWPRSLGLPSSQDPHTQMAKERALSDVTHIPLRPPAPAVTSPAQAELRLHLQGIHPDAPWTQPVQVELKDRRGEFYTYTREVAVVADGKCVLALPAWYQQDLSVEIHISGSNPGYRRLDHHKIGKLMADKVMAVPVRSAAELNGRVTDKHGDPVAHARIAAYSMRMGRPIDGVISQTGSDKDGVYRLLAPPDVRLLIVVAAMRPNALEWLDDDGVGDVGSWAPDLLPASRDVQLAIDHPGAGCACEHYYWRRSAGKGVGRA